MPTLNVWNGTGWDVVSGPPGPAGATGAQGPGGGNFNLTLSGNTSGAMAQVSSGTLTLAGGNNITLSQAGNAVTIVGPTPPVQATRSFLVSSFGQTVYQSSVGSMYLTCQPLPVQANLTCTEFDWMMSLSSQSTASVTVSASLGIYSWANTTSLALASSGSVSYSWGSATSSNYSGLRQWSCPFNAFMTPGDYVAAVWLRISGSLTCAMMGESVVNFVGSAGAANAASAREMPGLGVYSATFSTAMPSALLASVLVGTSASGRMNDMIFRALGA